MGALFDAADIDHEAASSQEKVPAAKLHVLQLEPIKARLGSKWEKLSGLVHTLFDRSMTKIEPVCYLSDLFTAPVVRGRGIGRALIEGVYAQARAAGSPRVYWQTHQTNAAGRLLYDQVAKHLGFIVYSHEL